MTDPKIVLITGANTGIGYQTVKALLKSDKRYLILLGTRSLSKGEAAIDSLKTEVPESSSSVHPIVIDIASDESIEAASKEVEDKWGRIDTLINNAGGWPDPFRSPLNQVDNRSSERLRHSFRLLGADPGWEFKAGRLTRRELMEKTFDVNVSGAYIVTETLMLLLLKSSDARLVFVTSGQSSLTAFSNGTMPLPPPPGAGLAQRNGIR
ncbi:hypothetical protein AnigIFM63604_010654 [Aspergillus niger]|uniref:NAD(P)-binding protein n=1 Tax=Aspergillus niger TaxID=5061 RepID=A0A9W6E7F1_ASPNG|nr:hypothetical protein CBS147321_6595 [Aspergillus niger]KAI2947873.1 hypothetical protein CBS147322_6498 [Aspergillus niger]KAI3029524.1 hypothetical protein CBS147482_50 [Aspergillus niger]KAI3060073.1 hypothetical protein CBS147352_432 [Aspergillus niger]GLA46570.1 hypothetical protein AnigIFM63604_010654 [Aspergillus niger]